MKRKFIICRPLDHRDDELKGWWIALCRVSANVCFHLYRNGSVVTAAFEGSGKTNDQLLNDQNSGWCTTKEECIKLCEKYGHEYEVKE